MATRSALPSSMVSPSSIRRSSWWCSKHYRLIIVILLSLTTILVVQKYSRALTPTGTQHVPEQADYQQSWWIRTIQNALHGNEDAKDRHLSIHGDMEYYLRMAPSLSSSSTRASDDVTGARQSTLDEHVAIIATALTTNIESEIEHQHASSSEHSQPMTANDLSPPTMAMQRPMSVPDLGEPPSVGPTTLPPTTPSMGSSPALPIVEWRNDCTHLAPCRHIDHNDDSDFSCVQFYAKRFWDAAPPHFLEDLEYQRLHRPPNCWYETEMLTFQKKTSDHHKDGDDDDPPLPYDNAVCVGSGPQYMVYWHNFKVGGTTARYALGKSDSFPLYEIAEDVYSEQYPQLTMDNFDIYWDYVDAMKEQIYEQQRDHPDNTIGFTFVRSPVQRFLSGLEQIERLNDHDWEVSTTARHCMDLLDPIAKVECIVDTIEESRIFFNVHIYPQAYLFDTWTKNGKYDLAITVLDLKHMDALFKRFKGEEIHRARVSAYEGTKLNLIATELEHSLLVKICALYEVDLLLLATLGMPDELCTDALAIDSA